MSQHYPIKLKYLQVFLSLTGIGLLLALVLRWFQSPDLNAQRMKTLTQHSLIQVYTNHNPATSYREPYRKQTRLGDNLEQIIVEQIQQARSSIEVAVQELRSPLIAQALRDRHRAGVRVRVAIENTYSRPWSSITPTEVQKMDARMQGRYRENIRLIDRNGDGKLSPDEIDNNDALQVLRKAGMPYLDDTADGSAGSGLMHHKFVVIDGQRVIVTSANFTMSDLHGDFSPKQSLGNANSLIVLQSPAIATLFIKEFNILWGDGPRGKLDSQFGIDKPFRPAQTIPVGDATVSVKFSPTPADIPWEFSSNGLISGILRKSRKTVDLALFVFSDQQIANQLETVVQKGTSLRVLIDPTFAFQYYSEALDLLGVALPIRTRKVNSHPEEPTQPSQSVSDKTCSAELENHPWSQPIQTVGMAKLPPGDLLHHKFGVVDRRTVIMGSHNWTEAADRQNDETLLAIEHPTVAAHYNREYERLWASSSLGLPAKISENTQKMQQNCRPSKAEASSSETNSPEISTAKVNLNTATLQEIEQLPGVGPKLAKRILAARQNQSFQSLAELDRVPGVGKKVLREIGDRVTW
jgi:competence ComEA-like helix-hairpin-helix protein